MSLQETIRTIRNIMEAEEHGARLGFPELMMKLEKIEQRQQDHFLRVAVIGEFNAGKSTFINALLRHRLLREGVMPTTAAATRLRRGTGRVSVGFSNGKEFDKFDSLADYLKRRYLRTISTREDAIAALTSEQNIAKDIARLDIEVLGFSASHSHHEGLPEQVELIDTPGFNPGDANVANHYEVTRNVVEKYADLAVILTPVNSAMSATLIAFLENHVPQYIHQCVFVITKVDGVTEEEKISVVQMVRGMIESRFRIASPCVFAVAARPVLPVKNLPPEMEESWRAFRAEFSRFEKILWEKLERARNSAVQASLARLLKPLTEEISRRLEESQKIVESSQNFIAEHTPESVAKKTYRMLVQQKDRICAECHKVKRTLTEHFQAAERECKARVATIVRSGGYLDDFEKSILPRVTSRIETSSKEAAKRGSEIINSISAVCEEIVQRFREQFARDYQGMPVLDVDRIGDDPSLMQVKTTVIPQAMVDKKFLEETKKIEGTSLFLSTALGTMLIPIPVVGSLIGAFIGVQSTHMVSLLWRKMTGRTEADVQRDVLRKINVHVGQVFRQMLEKAGEIAERICNSRINSIECLAEKHVTAYGKAVDETIRRNNRRMKMCDSQIKRMRSSLHALSEISKELQQMTGK